MNYGAEPADQVVRYSLEGMEYSLKITGNVAKHVAIFIAAALKDQKKTRGKTRLTRMLKEQRPMKFFTVPRMTCSLESALPSRHCIRYSRIRILLSGNAGCDEKRMSGQTVTSGRHPVSWTKK